MQKVIRYLKIAAAVILCVVLIEVSAFLAIVSPYLAIVDSGWWIFGLVVPIPAIAAVIALYERISEL